MQFECRKRLHFGIGGHALLLSVAAELAAHQVLRIQRRDSLKHLHLFVANGFAVRADGRLHRQIRQHLEQVVLHHVTDGANLLIKRAPPLNPKILGHRNLHALDVRAIPKRLQQHIGKAEEQHAVDGLFAQVMVNTKNRLLVKRLEQDLIESTR